MLFPNDFVEDLFVDMLIHFKVMHSVPEVVTESSGFPAKFLGVGKKILKVGFKVLPHTKLVCKFCASLLRDGRDPLSTNLESKPTNKKGTAQKHKLIAGYCQACG